MFELEALLIVDSLLPLFDLHSNIDMIVNKLLAFSDIELLNLCHIGCHLLDWHILVLSTKHGLNLIQLSGSYSSKSTHTYVTNLLEDHVLIVQFEAYNLRCILLLSSILRWVKYFVIYLHVARFNTKRLIKLTFIVLLNAKRRNQINWSIQ